MAAALAVQPGVRVPPRGETGSRCSRGHVCFDGALVLLQEANTQVQRCTETSLPDEAECHDPILWVEEVARFNSPQHLLHRGDHLGV